MLEIWHNPRCSKCRQTLQIIEDAGAEVRVRHYLDEALRVDELDRVLEALGMEPCELARLGEAVAQALGLGVRQMSRGEWLEVMARNPILVERPIVVHADGRAIVGRPPENVKELL